MKTLNFLVIIFLFIFSSSVGAQGFVNIDITGYARNYTGVLLNEDNDFSIVQNTLDLNFEKRTARGGFKVNPYVYHYFDRELELGLREAYLDLYFNNLDIRVGKQQIIWGKAEGVFITDVVSPKDLREFLLPDFDEIRTGITAVKLNYFKGVHNIEAVWTPVFTPTQMPGQSSIWAPQMPFPMEPEWDYSAAKINPSLENSEVFLRYSMMGSNFDFEFVGGHFFYDDPSMFVTREMDMQTQQLTGLTVRPEYQRVTMGGGSFSLPLGGLVLRGEGAYYTGRHFQTADPLVVGSKVEKDNLHYMAGLDYTIGGVRLSAQFIQEYILDYDDALYNDELDNTMTFLAKKDFFREKLWIELFSYIGLNNSDALIRPKATYSLADGFDLLAGANLFVGDEGRFGQYDDNDMVYMKLKYNF
ncbi:MAG: hypothetical protein K9G70_09380 [Prolixibacteraceae bacterium]|nr:hypothetical protein [Prolixibacteraceae bacterium]